MRSMLLVCLVAMVAAGCSGRSRERPATESNAAAAQRALQEQYGQYVRVTSLNCSPHRRSDALESGDVPLCAPFDSIPAVDQPRFAPAAQVSLPAAEPVVALDLAGEHRAYPVRYLIFHEVVNDTVGGRPVVVSFCPLCNSATAHSRQLAGRTLVFGVSGQLASANLIMFDRQTLTFWQQITGTGLVGPLAGRHLEPLPVTLLSYGAWRAAYPDGQVMLAPRGPRLPAFPYGSDPYAGYDRSADEQSPVLRAQGLASDPRLPPKQRVLGVANEHGAVAFPLPRGAGRTAVESGRLGQVPLVAFFRYGAAEPETRATLAHARRGWAGTVWVSRLGLRPLRFVARPGGFVETTTGSRFDFFGRARSGPLAGRRLIPSPQETAFWFAWAHFHPRTTIAPPSHAESIRC